MAADDLTFLYGEYVPACTHHIDKVYEGYCTLQYMAAGVVDLTIGSRRQVLKGENFWSAYPGPRVRFFAGGGTRTWTHRYIAFRGSLVERWMREGLFPVVPQAAPKRSGEAPFAARFDRLLALSGQTERRLVLRAVHLLEGILLDLADARSGGPEVAEVPWIEQAMERLRPFVEGGDPDYAAVAEGLGVSESTFRRRFRAAAGVSPHAHLLHSRVGAARRLLVESEDPIKLIAARLGYKDVYFFSRQFRLVTGVPPAVYRRSRQR